MKSLFRLSFPKWKKVAQSGHSAGDGCAHNKFDSRQSAFSDGNFVLLLLLFRN
jgi:hypothetical protein